MGFTAGGDKEEVLDGGPFGHSVFTGRLIETLKKADDYITAKELMSIVKEKVFIDAKDRGHKQTPDGGTLWGQGDFVFIPNVLAKADKSREALEKAKIEQESLEKELANLKQMKDDNEKQKKRERITVKEKSA